MTHNYHKELESEIIHFLAALKKFAISSSEERSRLTAVMDKHLKLIHAAADELYRSGVHKEMKLVEHAYQTYLANVNEETYANLNHAISTLREYNC